ncbi:unnamed protein product [Clonostachys chloroleuca]|uniref:Uncharacterized protein n=1 Tax=Clonostachys chloroleuca TaxID=1926264 RepID=A0AA35M9R4_9HYPO|nr:unnamed protein product [Clonostachys chloroleuca]
MDGQARGDLEGAADLPAVPAAGRAGEVLVVLGRELEDLGVLDHEGGLAGHAVALGLDLLKLGDIDLEDLAGLGLVKGWLLGLNTVSNCLVLSLGGGGVGTHVVERQVDSALESTVNLPNSVGRQEEEPIVVLENSQEDGNEGVALHVCKTENVLERRFDFVGGETEVAARNHEQGLAVLHRDSLSGRRLTHTGHTILVGALNGRVGVAALEGLALEVGHDEPPDHVLVVGLDAQVLEHVGLAAHGVEEVEVDGEEATLAEDVGEHALGDEDEVLVAELEEGRVGLEGAGALDADAEEGVLVQVIAALADLDAVRLLDDLGLGVGQGLAVAVEPVLDGHLVVLGLAVHRVVDGELVEAGAPVGHLLVRLAEIDDHVALDELGVAHLLVVLAVEDLIIGIVTVAVRGWVPGQRPSAVLLVSVVKEVDELAALALERVDELLVPMAVADGEDVERVDLALADEGLDGELLADGTERAAVVVNVIGLDLEVVAVIVAAEEVVTKLPSQGTVCDLGLGNRDLAVNVLIDVGVDRLKRLSVILVITALLIFI